MFEIEKSQIEKFLLKFLFNQFTQKKCFYQKSFFSLYGQKIVGHP